MMDTMVAQPVMLTLIPAMTLLIACKESTKHWKVGGNRLFLVLLERKGSLHPFKDLNVGEQRAELQASKGKFYRRQKDGLQKELFTTLGGTTRFPTLPHTNDVSVEKLILEKYELLFFEACTVPWITPQELPHHITGIDALIKWKECFSIQCSKDKLRDVDYRKTVVYITVALYPVIYHQIRLLLCSSPLWQWWWWDWSSWKWNSNLDKIITNHVIIKMPQRIKLEPTANLQLKGKKKWRLIQSNSNCKEFVREIKCCCFRNVKTS